jgi:hypothetical protein
VALLAATVKVVTVTQVHVTTLTGVSLWLGKEGERRGGGPL